MQTFALVVALALLALVLIFFGLFMTSVVAQLKWLVPFVPTPRVVARAMIEMAGLKPGDRIADLGAGDGRVLIMAKKARPGVTAVGYEGALGVWLLARLRVWLSKTDVEMKLKNFYKQDLSEFSVIFAYLSPQAMARLGEKFQSELRPGTKIVSHAFKIPGITPVETRKVPHWMGRNTKVYRYVWEKQKIIREGK
ncbi:hypothetical protein A3C52_02905 [Candidatus Peribacteria bacterium RIFCSPHIGHO2_02_FULL_51_15]|nr:MAG: hypothetical protein A3C52_02905 [Candidatus Peribacteria bacterium RIFCSPHIGHO2_02_FULL_51_15]